MERRAFPTCNARRLPVDVGHQHWLVVFSHPKSHLPGHINAQVMHERLVALYGASRATLLPVQEDVHLLMDPECTQDQPAQQLLRSIAELDHLDAGRFHKAAEQRTDLMWRRLSVLGRLQLLERVNIDASHALDMRPPDEARQRMLAPLT